jgi:nucleoside-diphosphate-sugar epimerase
MLLITGATGFLGKNLIPRISKHNSIRIMARITSHIAPYIGCKNVHITFGDIASNEGLADALVGVDTVIHCAARTIGKNFIEYYTVNTLGTLHLVHAMQRAGTRRIVFLSTHAVCGPTRDKHILDERTLPQPVSHYGRSKHAAENIIKDSGLDYIILRPVAVYGPHDMDVLKYIRLINTGVCPVVGFGEKYVNLLHIDDLVRLIMTIVTTSRFTNKTYFVHDGHCYSYTTVLKTIADILEKKIRIVHVPKGLALTVGLLYDVFIHDDKKTVWRDKMRELAGTCWLCCNDEVKQDYDFVPHYDMSRGMRSTIEWYRSNHLL